MTLWKWLDFHLRRLQAALVLRLLRHPLQPGQVFYSPGGSFKYRVVGSVCQLYDRANLPYPCCRLSWGGKEPSWRRIGRRFVPDIGALMSPTYCVQLVDYPSAEPVVKTLHWIRLTPTQQEWWYSKRLAQFKLLTPVWYVMKSGKTLTQLAQELERQSTTKKDFIANTSVLEMTPTGELALEGDTTHEFPITEHAHTQIAARLDIPGKYYNRMRAEAPALLATNVNEWFHSKPERRMVRTLDGQMRAFKSDRAQTAG